MACNLIVLSTVRLLIALKSNKPLLVLKLSEFSVVETLSSTVVPMLPKVNLPEVVLIVKLLISKLDLLVPISMLPAFVLVIIEYLRFFGTKILSDEFLAEINPFGSVKVILILSVSPSFSILLITLYSVIS